MAEWLIVLVRSFMYLLFFFSSHFISTEREMLTSPTVIVTFLFSFQFLLNILQNSLIKHMLSYDYYVFLMNLLFQSMKHHSVSLVLLFVLKSTLSHINIATSAFQSILCMVYLLPSIYFQVTFFFNI